MEGFPWPVQRIECKADEIFVQRRAAHLQQFMHCEKSITSCDYIPYIHMRLVIHFVRIAKPGSIMSASEKTWDFVFRIA